MAGNGKIVSGTGDFGHKMSDRNQNNNLQGWAMKFFIIIVTDIGNQRL